MAAMVQNGINFGWLSTDIIGLVCMFTTVNPLTIISKDLCSGIEGVLAC